MATQTRCPQYGDSAGSTQSAFYFPRKGRIGNLPSRETYGRELAAPETSCPYGLSGRLPARGNQSRLTASSRSFPLIGKFAAGKDHRPSRAPMTVPACQISLLEKLKEREFSPTRAQPLYLFLTDRIPT